MEGLDHIRAQGLLKHIYCCHLSLKGGVLGASRRCPQETLVIYLYCGVAGVHVCLNVYVCVCSCICYSSQQDWQTIL